MKYTRHLVVAAGAVVVVVAVVWFLRNSLIERMSSPTLARHHLTLTYVSLDAMSSSNASIGHLELLHDNGTTIAIDNLSLPISSDSAGLKKYSAARIKIVSATRDENEAFELAQLIDQFLLLPDSLGDTEFVVGELIAPPYAELRDVRVVLLKTEQRLNATIDAMPLSITIKPADSRSHSIALSLPPASANAGTQTISASMQHNTNGISIDGLSSLDLPSWQSLAQLAGIVPPEINVQSGTADVRFALEIPYDTEQLLSVVVELTPTSALQLVYDDKSGAPATVNVLSGSVVQTRATFPGGDWSLQQQKSSIVISYDDWTSIPVAMSELSCQAGPQCFMKTRVTLKKRRLPTAEVGNLTWTSAETVVFSKDNLRIDVQADATLEASDVLASETRVKKLSAKLGSTAALELLKTGWRLTADSVDARVENMAVSDGISVTVPLFLENLVVDESDQLMTAKTGVYVPQSTVAFASGSTKLPGFKGTLTRKGEIIAADLETLGMHQNGTVVARYNLTSGAGQLDLANAGLSFAAQNLSKRVSPWTYDWDLVAGTLFMDSKASWKALGSEVQLNGQAILRAENLAGHYTDTAFVDLSTRLQVAYDAATGLSANPATLTVGLIDTGVALEKITANYQLLLNEMSIDVTDLRMSAFGGALHANPFSFRTAATTNTVILSAEGIRLDRLLTLEEFSAVKVSGTVGAELPITIGENSITISNGRLFGEPPGGVIRYLPESTSVDTDASSIGFVTRALSNFEYKTLTSEIEYNADGDLKLQLQLTGKSPGLDETRPVVLNLGVENNIPQMLKSLRAARSVEEILEKRLQK